MPLQITTFTLQPYVPSEFVVKGFIVLRLYLELYGQHYDGHVQIT